MIYTRLDPNNKQISSQGKFLYFLNYYYFPGMVGFNYVIEMAPDKKYGAPDPETGEWNGVVRQILEKVPHSFECIPRSIVLTLPIIAATFEFSKVMTQIPIAES